MKKVVLVGCGNVGMSYAYALVVGGVSLDELVLIDINKQKAEGEALDLSHALAYSGKHYNIKAGDYSDCDDATIVCIAAGRNQEVGETRQDLIDKNYGVFKDIIGQINKTKFKGIYLIATNPLDIMTYITYKLSGFKPNKVIGSGTTLDSARLRYMISQELDISSKNIHAYVIGEHGDSEFIPWDNAVIGLNPATEFLDDNTMSRITYEVKNSAYDIINKKGNTSYGIGMCLLKITNAILNNENTIFTVSCYDKEHDIYIGKPSIINKNGVKKTLYIKLNEDDANKMTDSLEVLKETKVRLFGNKKDA